MLPRSFQLSHKEVVYHAHQSILEIGHCRLNEHGAGGLWQFVVIANSNGNDTASDANTDNCIVPEYVWNSFCGDLRCLTV